ncbi:hypothetical protein ODC80_004679 [Salmonella enterica]|nr:hypothetical protein [Salmonella enterica]EJX0554249.1 hypothetical protein [Salmonella enterica]EJX0602055.1 hypothetical protein [Salmonella enterica]
MDSKEDNDKYNRISVEANMKNGPEVDAPVTDEISGAVAFAIKWVAVGITVSPVLYGLARLIIALKS